MRGLRGQLSKVATLVAGSGAQLLSNAAAALLATLWLTPQDRGVMVVCMTVASIVGLTASFGIGNVYRSRLPRASGLGHGEDLRRTYSVTAATCVVAAAALSFAGMLVLTQTGAGQGVTASYLAVTILSAVVQTAQILVVEARFATGHFIAGSRWAAVAALGGFAALALAGVLGATGSVLLGAQAGVSGVVLLSATLAAARAGSLQFRRTSPRAVADFIRHGTASMGLSLGIVVMSRTDRLFLAAFATPATVAVYALGVTLAELLRLVPTAVGQLLTQKVAEGTVWATVFRTQVLTGLATMLLGGVGSVLAWFLIPVVFGVEYAGARVVVVIMVLGEIAYAFLVLATRGLIGGGWSRPASIIGCVAVAVALPLYALAASAGGVLGTAWGRVGVSVLTAVAASGRLRRQLTST